MADGAASGVADGVADVRRPVGPEGPAWQQRVADRSLAKARAKLATLASRLVDVARQLTVEAGGPTFTVAQVVARAHTSLSSFYRCFPGKDELLVAMFEDDARRGADALGALAAEHEDPLERLRAVVVGLFGFVARHSELPYASTLVGEHLRLAGTQPEELRQVLRPFVECFERELTATQAAGVTRAGDPERDASMVFLLVEAHLQAIVCGQIDGPPSQVAEELWAFCSAALAPVPGPAAERGPAGGGR